MKTAFIITFSIWILVVFFVGCTKGQNVEDYNKFMADQVYSVYLEKANYIHEVDMGLQEYNPNMDKSLGIEIDLLCTARGRSLSQCWLQMLFSTGAEYRAYKGF